MEIGDKVVKCKEDWVANDFDSWGRGQGIGVIVEPPFELNGSEFDVRWPGGRCFENEDQILLHFDSFEQNSKNHFHDAILTATGEKPSYEKMLELYDSLPLNLKRLAEDWGMNDTDFREQVIKLLKIK